MMNLPLREIPFLGGKACKAIMRELYLQRHYRALRVKTLGPSQPDLSYPCTRSFYGKMDVTAIEERRDIWPKNGCLIMKLSLTKA